MKKISLFLTAICAMLVPCVAKADLTNMVNTLETEVTNGINTIQPVVITVLIAAFAFVLVFYAYKLIRRSVK